MQDVGITGFYIQYRTLENQDLNNKLNFKFRLRDSWDTRERCCHFRGNFQMLQRISFFRSNSNLQRL